MTRVLTQLRTAAAEVARRARYVRINAEAIPGYAATLAPGAATGTHDETPPGSREQRAAFWLTLDAVNFGSGWFPTLRKRSGRSGYHTVAAGIRDRFEAAGAWTPLELQALTAADVAATLGQDPHHELMALFAVSLNELGRHVDAAGGFASVVEAGQGSAERLVERIATWGSFADVSTYEDLSLPFLKRAQIVAADVARAGVAEFGDLHRLTMFADNLVPHVLHLDGILGYEGSLVERIDREELIEHGSAEEVEIRACALHAVELIVAQHPQNVTAAEIDQVLWLRGGGRRYKALPRHRSRCTAY